MQHRKGRNATNNAQIRIICRIFDIFYRNNLHKCEKSSIFVVAFGISMFFFGVRKIREVAQLVAHHVRDVGVGRSSRLFSTKKDGQNGHPF